MKFKLIIPIIIFFICLSSQVKAIDFEPEGEDETTYNIDLVSWFTGGPNEEKCLGDIGKGSITLKGYYLCGYKNCNTNSCNVELILYNKNGKYNTGQFLKNITHILPSSNYKYSYKNTRGYFNYKTLVFDEGYNPATDFTGELYWRGILDYASTNNHGKFYTNIPIFLTEAEALGYINGTVSIKEATNYVDIVNNNVEHDCSDIPVPKNLKVIEESGKYYLTWEQTEEELELFTCSIIQFDTENIKYRYEPIKNVIANTSSWIGLADTLIYGSGSTIDYEFDVVEKSLVQKVDITASMLEFKKWCMSNKWVAYKVDMIYTVVNIEGLADSTGALIGTRQSSYVKAVVSVDWTEDSGMNVDVEYKHVDSTGALVNDSTYNKFGYGTDILNTSNGSNFIGNIVSGFNLLGDNGLIALITQTFSYIPAPIWTLVGAGISICIIVALFKMIL